ncbi:RND family transporter [Mycobacterium sp. OTB74]|uniref:MMPL/RND family transporter n=1 Tax=Mycobacterium sp. OTB74 TaxID=1853452 RepID=UPI00247428E0|nr:RND family transporter [Mycobacterium sp. OTB74]MDH6244462.1 RND superfamily putative drug exporter [Mycobacterium sp. OTB74]
MSNHQLPIKQPHVARFIHRFAPLIILAWVGVLAALGTLVPPLEQVEKEHSASLSINDAPSFEAAARINKDFGQSAADGMVMVVLEGEQPLGDEAHQYYDQLIHQFEADPKHVMRIQDFWGDSATAGAAQSNDGKAAYVQLDLAGGSGQTSIEESVAAVNRVVAQTSAPPGVKAYVTGPSAIAAEMVHSGDRTMIMTTAVSVAVICITLLIVYRSIITVFALLLTVGVEMAVARGAVAFLGQHGILGLSTLAVNLLVSLAIAAGTDYGIFFLGRYQEARQSGEEREAAYYTAYRGVAKVILASGVTIAGAIYCLSFTRLAIFSSIGAPCAVGVLVVVAVALTLVPAFLAVGGRFGVFELKRKIKVRGWRRIGTAIVRWPGPILVASLALALVGLITLPAYIPSYSDQQFIPKNIPANTGLMAAERHFPTAAMKPPEMLLVEADHDLRNSTDFLVLEKLAKALLAVPGVAKVQAPTRPEGAPVAHSTIPYLLSMQQAGQQQFMHFQNQRMDDMLKQTELLTRTIEIMKHMYSLMKQMAANLHDTVAKTHDMQAATNDLRNDISDFEDMFRPIRNYLYWEPHCYDIPMCYSVRSIFDTIDGVDALSDMLNGLVTNLDQMDVIMPQLIAQFPEMLSIMETMRSMMLTMHSTMSGVFGEMNESATNPTAMAKAFDAAKNDDSFYAPPELFKNQDFLRVMKSFMSPDGKAVRMFISQKGDPASPEGMARVDMIKTAAVEGLKGTPLEDSKIYLAGTAASTKDIVTGSRFDLMIAVVSALCLIFIIMLIMTRSFVAALVIVGTVLLSLGASFGLSVLVWQYLLGFEIHWTVLLMSVIILLAVGSDYNLLLVARMKEELAAGINTGIIRAMGGTGKVVTTAGLVFAFTMGSMVVSDLRSIGQVGSTIALGLLFDTLVVRAFMTPSIAALLGRWFWWPQKVRPRPASSMLRSTGPRPLVRALLQNQQL